MLLHQGMSSMSKASRSCHTFRAACELLPMEVKVPQRRAEMPLMVRLEMVRWVSFGGSVFCKVSRNARRRSKMLAVGQMRWRFSMFGRAGSLGFAC